MKKLLKALLDIKINPATLHERKKGYPIIKNTIGEKVNFKVDIKDPNFHLPIENLTKIYS